ncbi:Flagellar basal body-associated protein FliL [Rickettsiales endosymbiont of Paramecium tredecaurelia]|uniref:flagellar basal body-associated FliL family protein n=1 Tax=Candidatus Sarmatiella mevalonica TaxID=2770581 RepID=UPI001921BD41|nr:flagellar basal body-associated FliL family protein [Candidatus Sarmatiella mevalonica]MBL3284755.1 Flagellar basal body-associated protein FliL [Candidatus Sarmatiella mevalonica]
MSDLDPTKQSALLSDIDQEREKYEAKSLLIKKISRYLIIGLVIFFICVAFYALFMRGKRTELGFDSNRSNEQQGHTANILVIPTITTAIYSGSSSDQENETISLALALEVVDNDDLQDLRDRIPEISDAVTVFLSQVYKSDFSTSHGVQIFKEALFLYLRNLLSPCEIRNVLVTSMSFH